MAEVKCVEPALANKEGGSDYVCVVKGEDTLIFPHVDVCMAVVWLQARNWAMIGGHVPGKWDQDSNDDLKGCAERVLSVMNRQWHELRSVDLIITMGDPSGVGAPAWTDIVNTMVANLGAQRFLKIWKDTPGGADLKVDGPARKLTVTSSRTRQAICERTFDSITRGEELRIRYDAPELFKMVEDLRKKFTAIGFLGNLHLFHDSCSKTDQERIDKFFKESFQKHGACTDFQAPMDRGLSGDATFTFADGEKAAIRLELAEKKWESGATAYRIRNITPK